jgi:dCMP deaminase
MPTHNQWDSLFLKMAYEVSLLSKDPSTKCGSIIVTPNRKNISFGYNGFVSGVEETNEMWNERPKKYLEVIHSEQNNILNCPFDTNGCSIYITHQPCTKCIILLAQSGISKIIYSKKYDRIENLDVWEKYSKLFLEVRQVSI